MYKRQHHNAVAAVLGALNADILEEAECYFGGGTAITLLLGEYRESVDIDFLCASGSGYRRLREMTHTGTLDALLDKSAGITELRDVRADQYGVRTWLGLDETRIKFEIIREARIDLAGARHPELKVPVLQRSDLYCEKLLANADRHADRSVLSRDIIDLAMMISRWGQIPDKAWEKARAAYGWSVDGAFEKAVQTIRYKEWLLECMRAMAMEQSLAEEILGVFGGPEAQN